jgi:hypothetical protein
MCLGLSATIRAVLLLPIWDWQSTLGGGGQEWGTALHPLEEVGKVIPQDRQADVPGGVTRGAPQPQRNHQHGPPPPPDKIGNPPLGEPGGNGGPLSILLRTLERLLTRTVRLTCRAGCIEIRKENNCYLKQEGITFTILMTMFDGFGIISLTAIGACERQLFNKLRGTVVSCQIFIRSQSLIAR